ncbi:MAG: tetratricopeptide repeat protein, partial [Spirochaetes bacterium]|nr:tetratricopeptide repeat protein [Spirochaetota bacterium]
MTEKAWKFIKTGIIDNIDISILAAECNSLLRQETQKSVKNAIALSRKFVKYSLPFKGEMLQTAYRAQGWALHVGGQYKKAEKNYLQARLLSNKDPLTRARIDRILIDIYMYQGNFKEAQKRSRQALNTFKKIKAYEDAAKTLINYGNLYHRQDRHQEALKQYKKVETFFKSKSNNLILALCYYNQANTLVQLIDFKKAYPLYKKAENIFEQLNFYLYANEARYGLSWLMMLQGDFHKSLDSLSKCMKIYQKASQPKGVMLCNLDMAEAYLSLNLISDSIRSSTIAEKQARKLKLNYEAAKASFFLAKATYATGKESKAKKILIRAREGFEKEKNYGFLAAVQLMSILMNSKSKNKTKELQLARNNFSKSQMPLWEAICDLQIGTSGIESKSAFDRLRKNPAVKTVPCLYAHWQTILGDSYADANKLTLAQKHWINAANMLDSVRMKLPPVELRNSFFENRSDPYLKIIETTAKDNPEKAALWAERFKTAGLWASIKFDSATHKVRHKAENSLAQLANQVMNLSYQIDDRSGKRSIVYNQNHRLYKSLQKQVRQNFIAIDIFY